MNKQATVSESEEADVLYAGNSTKDLTEAAIKNNWDSEQSVWDRI